MFTSWEVSPGQDRVGESLQGLPGVLLANFYFTDCLAFANQN